MTVRLGTFDAESWWRPADLAALPSVGGAGPAVGAMDELLAGFCVPGDLLITRHPLAASIQDGLGAAFGGTSFDHISLSDSDPGPAGLEAPGGPDPGPTGPDASGDSRPGPIEREILADQAVMQRIRGREITPYAVLPETWTLVEQLLPTPEIVAEVNSKTWSNELVRDLGLPGGGRTVRSVDDLVKAVTALEFRALIKDPYGVSGRALIEVATPGVLRAVERVLRKQVEAGRRVELVVQEKYSKQHDFSGHLVLDSNGDWNFLGLQLMTNRGFRHFGSSPVPPGLIDEGWYAETLAEVVPAIAETGYWGPVGVDAMLLDDGTVIPVLEINARQSLGLLALELERHATEHGLTGHLWQLELNVAPDKGISDVFVALGNILYRGGTAPGVTVLSGSRLTAPGGRIYVAIFCPAGELDRWRRRLLAAVTTADVNPRGQTK
ncbi:hypothetical protein F1D05_09190 [Kribbella qitaiheensis]|uniref:ATP-grasp domain-containing protein n=1 Tax=Kribbella qitaiheensis TaxID=1544730 RepID=A0A7G6WVL3_9ACTN|nr:hypothetical protein [Kribbella qitaiheensis]QNE18028.1 hypothetical protein F1D05_09190 [Kribbella qitaiheensis]